MIHSLRISMLHTISWITSVSGLVSIGYAWEKVDIDPEKLMSRAEGMMREEKQKYYKNLKKGHHEPIIKQDLLSDIENGNFIVCLVPRSMQIQKKSLEQKR